MCGILARLSRKRHELRNFLRVNEFNDLAICGKLRVSFSTETVTI
jgi:hypothetical protein